MNQPVAFRPGFPGFSVLLAVLAFFVSGWLTPTSHAQTTAAYDLYVADFTASEIYGYTSAGVQHPFANNLTSPVGLAFDRSGNLYAADSGSGKIYKVSSTGSQSVFASGFDHILGLAFDAVGNLFAATVDASNVGSIIKFTPAGVQSTFATGLTRVRGLAFDAAGNLYEAELDAGSVYKFTPTGAKSTVVSGLNYPTGLAFDGSGNLFVCSQGVGVFKVTPAGTVSEFTTQVVDPRYLAFDATGNLYVTDVGDATGNPGQGNVYKFSPSGARTTFASNLAYPSGIAFAVTPATSTAAPVISSAVSATAQVGQAFNYQITASNTPTSFAAVGLPAGLSVNTSTGLISGASTQAGTFPVTLSATNASGTGVAVLSLTVTQALPVVSLVATTPSVTASSGGIGELTVSLSEAQDHDVTVAFAVKGTAVNGTDYLLLKGSKKIKAGKTSKPLKIIPQSEPGETGKKTVVLSLQPGNGYTVGTTGKVKVKIVY